VKKKKAPRVPVAEPADFEAEVQRAREGIQRNRNARSEPRPAAKSPITNEPPAELDEQAAHLSPPLYDSLAAINEGVQDTNESPAELDEPAVHLPPPLYDSLAAINKGVQDNSVGIRGEIQRSGKSSLRIQLLATLITAIGVLAAIYFGIRQQTALLEKKFDQGRFTISSPTDRSVIRGGQLVRGSTPFRSLNHYLLVTIIRTGDVYVQKQPVHVMPDGTFSIEARFDLLPVTDADPLKLQLLATSGTLSEDRLTAVPSDALFSEAIEVTIIETVVAPGAFVIDTPAAGATVGLDTTVTGKTPYPDRHNYIVITPKRTGAAALQDQPAIVNSSDGTFTGRVRLGGVQTGIGEQFMIHIIATKSELTAGPLVKEPDDAARSNTIIVTRK